MQETLVWFLGQEDSLEKGMATHSSILAWRIPWTEEPARLQSWGRKESDTTEELSTVQHSINDIIFFPFLLITNWSSGRLINVNDGNWYSLEILVLVFKTVRVNFCFLQHPVQMFLAGEWPSVWSVKVWPLPPDRELQSSAGYSAWSSQKYCSHS